MKPSEPTLHSFAPIIDEQATVLVLGSMPGQASLTANEYYAHRHNLFWQFPAQILGIDTPARYSERLAMLQHFRVALWDVLQQCQRDGSLDSSIIASSEQANDLVALLSHYSKIKTICFNGQKAYQSFKRHVLKAAPSFFEHYSLVVLPSTSPANASIPKDTKLSLWQEHVWRSN